MLVVSRRAVEGGDITEVLPALTRLLASPDLARGYRRQVDIAFHGYDNDPRELFEITEVRSFVYALDAEFPYWLYFLTLGGFGLQAIAFCFLPPFLTEEGRRKEWGPRLTALVESRWGPALAALASQLGHSDSDVDQMLATAGHYFIEGPARPLDVDHL